MALATRYDVSTQVDSETVAERLPAMCGSETFTTVVSSTSMKVANITATAKIQRLTMLGSAVSAQGSGAQGSGLGGQTDHANQTKHATLLCVDGRGRRQTR